MFFISPFVRQLPNFAQHPIIYKQKMIRVTVTNPALGTEYQFPKDGEIDNSIVKGIKFNPNVRAMANLIATVNLIETGVTFADIVFSRFIKVNLRNENDELLVQDQPLYSFAGVRSRGDLTIFNTGQCRVTPRTNMRLSLRKCSISITDNVFGNTDFTVLFTIDYLPLKNG